VTYIHITSCHFSGCSRNLRKATFNFARSVRPSPRPPPPLPNATTRLLLKRIFMKSDIWLVFFSSKVSPQNASFIRIRQEWWVLYMKTNDHLWYYIISRSVLHRMRNVSDRNRRENQNTHFVFNKVPLHRRKSCRLCDNVGKRGTARDVTDDSIIRRMRNVRWIPKATKTNTEYVMLIAFPLQKWLQEWA